MPHQIIVPPLGQTTDSVVLSTWYKRVGDSVKSGEPLFAIETDKATLDIEAPADGVLAEVTAQDGETVPVLSVIGMISAPGDGASAGTIPKDVSNVAGKVVPSRSISVQTGANLPASDIRHGRTFISPRARRLAEAEHVDWRIVAGTGPLGAIVERDVRLVLAKLPTSVSQRELRQKQSDVITPRSGIAVSPPFNASWTRAGHLGSEVNCSAIVELRKRLLQRSVSVSYDAILLYVLARVMSRMPQFAKNASGVQVGIASVDNDALTLSCVDHLESMRLVQVSQHLSSLPCTVLDAESIQAVQLVFFNLAEYGLDMSGATAFPGSIAVITAGRIRQTKAGDALMWLALDYNPDQLPPVAAMRLMQLTVQLLEDPDLLL